MKHFFLATMLAAIALTLTAATPAHALEQADPPLIRDTGGAGAGPGAGDPSLGGTRLPPGGDKAGVDAAERADKAAERKAKEAEKRKEEERQRQAAAAARKNDEMKRALSPRALTQQQAVAAPPVARIASAPAMSSTTAVPRRAALAPSALSR